jgi:hypothetical protein
MSTTLYQNISPWGDLWLGPRNIYVAENATYDAPDNEVDGLNAQPTNWRVV